MTDPKKKSVPAGSERSYLNVPITTMNRIREEAARECCSINYIVAGVLNAYARGEIRQQFVQQQPGGPLPGEPRQ